MPHIDPNHKIGQAADDGNQNGSAEATSGGSKGVPSGTSAKAGKATAHKRGKKPTRAAPEERELSPRERVFCEAFVQPKATGVSAARAAGYGGNARGWATRAQKLLARERVQAYIAELRARASEGAVMSLRERLERLSHIGRGLPVTHVLKNGDLVEGAAVAKDQVSAIAEIGKLEGDYTKKVEVNGTHRTLVDFIDALDDVPAEGIGPGPSPDASEVG